MCLNQNGKLVFLAGFFGLSGCKVSRNPQISPLPGYRSGKATRNELVLQIHNCSNKRERGMFQKAGTDLHYWRAWLLRTELILWTRTSHSAKQILHQRPIIRTAKITVASRLPSSQWRLSGRLLETADVSRSCQAEGKTRSDAGHTLTVQQDNGLPSSPLTVTLHQFS